MAEQAAVNRRVGGSIPSSGATRSPTRSSPSSAATDATAGRDSPSATVLQRHERPRPEARTPFLARPAAAPARLARWVGPWPKHGHAAVPVLAQQPWGRVRRALASIDTPCATLRAPRLSRRLFSAVRPRCRTPPGAWRSPTARGSSCRAIHQSGHMADPCRSASRRGSHSVASSARLPLSRLCAQRAPSTTAAARPGSAARPCSTARAGRRSGSRPAPRRRALEAAVSLAAIWVGRRRSP